MRTTALRGPRPPLSEAEDPKTATVEVIEDWDQARPYGSRWDELAVACSRPYCAPAWMGAWWLHAAPPGSMLRLILVLDGSELIGVAPLFADRARLMTRYRVLGARCSSSLDLLARPGTETEVAAAVSSALAECVPRPDVVMFEGIRGESPWPSLLADRWPKSSPALRPQFSQPLPRIDLRGRTYEDWFSSKSRNFRQGIRRRQRQLRQQGASVRFARTDEELDRDLRAFAELHYARWRRRGGSGVLDRRVEQMLREAGRRLSPNRFRLWSLEVEGRPVSSQLFLSAGEETSYWLGGFDEEWARSQVTLVTILASIEHAFAEGDQQFDLGAGGQDYKYRLADEGDLRVDWTLVVPKQARSPLARVQVLPERIRVAAAQKLSPEAKRAIRQIRGRLEDLRRPKDV